MKRAPVLLVVLCSVLLLGCSTDPGEKAGQYNFKQGVAETQFTFLENAPPEQIYPGSTFKIIVNVDNQAAYDITEGVVQIIGLDEKYLSVAPLDQPFNTLAGRSLVAPEGEKTFLEFDGSAGNLFENADEYTGSFFLTAHYRSTLDFADTLCINSRRYETYDAGCKVETHKSYDGQGAPLAVTELDEIIAPGEGAQAEFRLHLQNRGEGRVNQINLGPAKLGSEELRCHIQGEADEQQFVRFDERQEATVICTKYVGSLNSYSTTLSLSLVYDYEYRQQQSLKLVK